VALTPGDRGRRIPGQVPSLIFQAFPHLITPPGNYRTG
jgi:hypothetical protein